MNLVVDNASVSDFKYCNDLFAVVDFVYDAVISGPNPPSLVVSLKFAATRGSGVLTKRRDFGSNRFVERELSLRICFSADGSMRRK